jgi:hypothetical protein
VIQHIVTLCGLKVQLTDKNIPPMEIVISFLMFQYGSDEIILYMLLNKNTAFMYFISQVFKCFQ